MDLFSHCNYRIFREIKAIAVVSMIEEVSRIGVSNAKNSFLRTAAAMVDTQRTSF